MKILFCRIGWCTSYNGDPDDRPIGGGSYNDSDIGHEIHNYKSFRGRYYGYVRVRNSININKFEPDATDKTNNVLVVWCSTKPSSKGLVVVGWYNNATVYRYEQVVPADAMSNRFSDEHDAYIISSDDAFLLPANERLFPIDGFGSSMIYYGNDELNQKVEDYINNYDTNKVLVSQVEKSLSPFLGEEKKAVVKVRINQGKFRDGLINKFGKCCLCGVANENLLIASHLKPWCESADFEKTDINNGLLLCPNHDKLVDSGLISFDYNGKILISKSLRKNDRALMNLSKDLKIEITEDNASYVSYHRENIFQKE